VKADEFDAIRAEMYPPSWRDPAVIPECFALALDTLGAIACGPPDHIAPSDDDMGGWFGRYSIEQAEQALRRMAQRAKTGTPLYEPEDIRG
jgi:hypothetical protein